MIIIREKEEWVVALVVVGVVVAPVEGGVDLEGDLAGAWVEEMDSGEDTRTKPSLLYPQTSVAWSLEKVVKPSVR